MGRVGQLIELSLDHEGYPAVAARIRQYFYEALEAPSQRTLGADLLFTV
jgi:hypothetical protein